jgi:hypothetical protein
MTIVDRQSTLGIPSIGSLHSPIGIGCLGSGARPAHTARWASVVPDDFVKEPLATEYPANGSFFVPSHVGQGFSPALAVHKEKMVKPHG